MEHWYLIRHGLNRQVGRFVSDIPDLNRGQTVVLVSVRGTELGDVLLSIASSTAGTAGLSPSSPGSAGARVLRIAGPDDLERARRAELERPRQFATCSSILREGVWPLELIDVEPLLDERRTVLHYLGPHRLDAPGLVAAFRVACNLDVILEPAGIDVSEDEELEPEGLADQGCGSCGSEGGGCGSGGGGCGSGAGSSSSHGGCGDCGIKKLVASRSPAAR